MAGKAVFKPEDEPDRTTTCLCFNLFNELIAWAGGGGF